LHKLQENVPKNEWHDDDGSGIRSDFKEYLTQTLTFRTCVNIKSMNTCSRIRFFRQIIQIIKEKHDEHKTRHRNQPIRTIVNVTYNDCGLMHSCKHNIKEKGQPGNIFYKDLGTWKAVTSKLERIVDEINIEQSEVAKLLVRSSVTGKPIISGNIKYKCKPLNSDSRVTNYDAGKKKKINTKKFYFQK